MGLLLEAASSGDGLPLNAVRVELLGDTWTTTSVEIAPSVLADGGGFYDRAVSARAGDTAFAAVGSSQLVAATDTQVVPVRTAAESAETRFPALVRCTRLDD